MGRDPRSRIRSTKTACGVTLLDVDQLVGGYGDIEHVDWGAQQSLPGGCTEGTGCRRGGYGSVWQGAQDVPQEARMSRGPVAGRAGVLDEPVHQSIGRYLRCNGDVRAVFLPLSFYMLTVSL